MFTVFFARVNPTSNVANPKCITNTRKTDVNIHVLFTANIAGDTPPEPGPSDAVNPSDENTPKNNPKIKINLMANIS